MFALIDCNAFYCSCERLFDPSLRGRAVVVLSNNDGCVVSRTKEAKALAIPMGVPLFELRDHVDAGRLVALSSNYTLYGDLSHRVMTTLAEYGTAQEVYSIDECFLHVDDDADPARTMATARARVLHDVGIPTSIGIGCTKTLAKLASDLAKARPDGVFAMPGPGPALAEVLGAVPLGDVWGIGRRIGATFTAWGMRTALDLARAPLAKVRERYGVTTARVVEELRGVSCLALESAPAPKQTITVSRSFGHDVTAVEDLRAAVCAFAERAGEKLRAGGLAATHLRVWVEHNRFRADAPACSGACDTAFAVPTNLTQELIAAVDAGVRALWRPGGRWKKAGVLLLGLTPAAAQQTSLFDQVDRERMGALMQAMDAINARHGRARLAYGARGLSQAWQPTQQRCSRRWSTRWDELPVAR